MPPGFLDGQVVKLVVGCFIQNTVGNQRLGKIKETAPENLDLIPDHGPTVCSDKFKGSPYGPVIGVDTALGALPVSPQE